ncbi:beta-L-arabinofuranosidase domain-containing protein [Selenomonas ruminis]|uniref:beta-L-arabinofuranosidase domain-containing protein n=1 Tax=Selenomonas ruminis TaxID=2593411 RepID=UPI001655E93A
MDLYVGSEAEISLGDKTVELSMRSQFPWEGNVELATKADGRYGIALRIPSWAKTYKIAVNGSAIKEEKQNGYVTVRRNWHKDDKITLEVPMEATLYQAAPEVREDIGRLAVQRGPLVYCAESIDNGEGLERIRLMDGMEFIYEYSDKLFKGAGILRTDAVREAKGNQLYSLYGKFYRKTSIVDAGGEGVKSLFKYQVCYLV